MKDLGRLTLIGLSALLMTGVSVRADTLTLWGRATTQNFLPELVASFNASHKNQIDLQIIPDTEVVQKYATAVAGGSAPDMLSLDLIYVPAFASTGQLEDLTKLAHSFKYFDHLSPAHIRLGTYDGHIYGMPLYADGSIMFWNKKLFKQAGLDPEKGPTTWAELRNDAAKVTALGGDIKGYYFSGACAGCNAFTFLPFVWAQGGDILSKDGKTATLDTPAMREAIAFYRDLIKSGFVPGSSQSDTGGGFVSTFASGKIGMSPVGAFMIAELNKKYPEIDYGVSLIPGKDGGASSFVGGDDFVVTAGRSSKLPVIKEFLEYAYSPEQQVVLASHGNLPLRDDIAAQVLSQVDPHYKVAASALPVGKAPYSTVYNDLINSASGPWAQMINEVFFGNDVTGSIANAQKTMQSIIDSAAQ